MAAITPDQKNGLLLAQLSSPTGQLLVSAISAGSSPSHQPCAPQVSTMARAPHAHSSSFLLTLIDVLGVGRQSLSKAYPEFHEKKGIRRSPFKELLESTLFLWELVIDLADVHGFEVGVTVARA